MLRDALLIAAKDLRIEWRTREVVPTMTLFAVLVAVLASMSMFVDEATSRTVAPGVLWIVVAFAATLGLARSWAREREQGALQAVLLSPVDPAAVFLGKLLASLLFVGLTELLVAPLLALLLHAPFGEHAGGVALLLALGTLGFVGAGTLFGALTVKTRARDLVLAVVLYPLASPGLLCGVVGTRELLAGHGGAALWPWVKLLLAFDLVCVGGGLLLMGPLLEE